MGNKKKLRECVDTGIKTGLLLPHTSSGEAYVRDRVVDDANNEEAQNVIADGGGGGLSPLLASLKRRLRTTPSTPVRRS